MTEISYFWASNARGDGDIDGVPEDAWQWLVETLWPCLNMPTQYSGAGPIYALEPWRGGFFQFFDPDSPMGDFFLSTFTPSTPPGNPISDFSGLGGLNWYNGFAGHVRGNPLYMESYNGEVHEFTQAVTFEDSDEFIGDLDFALVLRRGFETAGQNNLGSEGIALKRFYIRYVPYIDDNVKISYATKYNDWTDGDILLFLQQINIPVGLAPTETFKNDFNVHNMLSGAGQIFSWRQGGSDTDAQIGGSSNYRTPARPWQTFVVEWTGASAASGSLTLPDSIYGKNDKAGDGSQAITAAEWLVFVTCESDSDVTTYVSGSTLSWAAGSSKTSIIFNILAVPGLE